MPRIAEKDAYRKFLSHGRNSSHFVWFLTRLDFFECSNGWIFAFLSKGSVTIFALEPLVPEDSYSGDAFHLAWEELKRELKPRIALFVSVNDEFLHLLKARGF